MIQTINSSQFHDAFYRMDRGNQFSYEALELIYQFFEDVDPNTKLDVIAICCEYTESSIEQIVRDYSIDCDFIEDDEIESHVLEYLNEHTIVIGVTDNGDVVYQQF